ncbi:MAG: type transport system ATP-binding protein [Thermoleophilaceae bacterium]|jgi:ABC-2 type transport system ATP-binding protein|nr:type transport system ATP-binding protein [Thermoleophilaceae bacterium]
MGRGRGRRLAGAAALAAALLAALAPGVQARDATVRSFDQTPISMHFFPAEGLAAGQRAPTVLIGPGWSSPGETDQNSSSSEQIGNVGLGPLRRAGYNVLTWDPRGFGRSGGQVEVDSPDYEAHDASALIDWLAGQPEAQLDRAGDPRVGMSGGSYGGGIQWVTAARDARVDVIAPNISWNSLITSLYKDGSLKAGWGSILCGAGIAASLPGGLLNPDGPEPSRLSPHVVNTCVGGTATGFMSPADQAWYAAHGPDHLLPRVRIPTLITQGTVDTLFTLKESIRNYASLRGRGVPVKMIWFCGGHGACLTGSGPAGHLERSVLSWFARYLKRDTSVQTGPRFEWLADDARWRSAPDYPLTRRGSLRAIGGPQTLPIAPTSPSGGLIAATPAVNAVELALPPASAAAHVLGEPTLKLSYSGTAAPGQTHVYAQIVDGSGRVVGNQATPIPVALDGIPRTVERSLEAIASEAAAGSTYKLQITPATTLYTPQRSAGAVTFSRIEIVLPIVG